MEINSNLNICPQRNASYQSFTAQYPLKDVMCIMSSSEIIGKRSDTFEKTVAGILNKSVGCTVEQRAKDYMHAISYLYEKYPQLGEYAQRFRSMLDSVSRNHFSITTEDAELVTRNIENQIGSRFIEIV